jgi:hypothetical protein
MFIVKLMAFKNLYSPAKKIFKFSEKSIHSRFNFLCAIPNAPRKQTKKTTLSNYKISENR